MNRLAFVLTLALLGVPAFSADKTRLTIAVKNELGKPIDRASVIVTFKQGRSLTRLGVVKNQYKWELRTSQEGTAKIPAIPQGKILVQVVATNYQTFGDLFEVDEDEKTIDITLKRPQAPYSAHDKPGEKK